MSAPTQAPALTPRVLWSFARPHTIIGTTLSVAALFTMSVAAGEPQHPFPAAVFGWALASCLAANVYIVGLNQLLDVDIDRINKPQLPLASGALSLRSGRRIVAGSLVLAIGIALWQGPYLAATVLASLAIGTLYSAPPVRLKRFHFWAAASIFTVRGLIVNIVLFLHFQTQLQGNAAMPAFVWLLAAFMFLFSLVIAWYKDIPDMQGDRRFEIATLTLQLGPERVFALGGAVLALGYLSVVAVGLVGIDGVNGPMLAGTHLILFAVARARALRTDPAEPGPMTRYYLFLWGLFYAEYLVFPLAVWLG